MINKLKNQNSVPTLPTRQAGGRQAKIKILVGTPCLGFLNLIPVLSFDF